MKIEISKEELNRILDWYGCYLAEGHDDDFDYEIYNKLSNYLKFSI